MIVASSLHAYLAHPDWANTTADLAKTWGDADIVLCLSGAAGAGRGITGQVRRSFLGALGPAASAEAQDGQPCPWDPPCALDVFCREQMRNSNGDGLPIPYVLTLRRAGPDLMVTLRLFGIASDWAFAAAEALVAGLRDILPWSRMGRPVPQITTRHIQTKAVVAVPTPRSVTVRL